jgi:hypothetical protein
MLLLMVSSALSPMAVRPALAAEVITLDGNWQFHQSNRPKTTKTVKVPNPFEVHEGAQFDGVGVYQRKLPKIRLGGRRAILRFHAAATQANVFVNGRLVKQHVGGWTPFEVDITDTLRPNSTDEDLLEVRVDEMVGHNSQGFLPVFAPHFGGIWQGVELRLVSDCWLDELTSFAHADASNKTWRITLKYHGKLPTNAWIGITTRRIDPTEPARWGAERRFEVKRTPSSKGGNPSTHARLKADSIELDWKPPSVQLWSPEDPAVYELRIRIGGETEQDVVNWHDLITLRSGFREVTAVDRKLLLNGRPIVVRGILNWGWAPPRTAPSIDEVWFRNELEQAKLHGFNLMKFCLWVPPNRYLEIADEVGMLTWIEYPTWHSQWSKEQLKSLTGEFTEFFQFDRHHPSIVLRSLTCETGPTADLEVIRALYDLCHQMVPGSVVEDDSSWIQWNRVHDFYDDHPYGNNHTWLETIQRLEDYIGKREARPLILGEAIAADTWYDRERMLAVYQTQLEASKRGSSSPGPSSPGASSPGASSPGASSQGASSQGASSQVGGVLGADPGKPKLKASRPFWFPIHFDGNEEWLQQFEKRVGAIDETRLREESLRYALSMRKYQIETFRRLSPNSGYVVSTIRDFPFAEMGLLDHSGQAKWSAEAWQWHSDIACLLETPAELRAFLGGVEVSLAGWVQHGGLSDALGEIQIELSVAGDGLDRQLSTTMRLDSLEAGQLEKAVSLEWTPPEVDAPTPFLVRMVVTSGDKPISTNQWTLWAVPDQVPVAGIARHTSCPLASLPPKLRHLPVWDSPVSTVLGGLKQPKLVIASAWDGALVDYATAGGRVVLLADGRPRSFATADHWFLRGGPVIMEHPVVEPIGREFLLSLQHLDLSGPVMPNLTYVDEVEPIMLLWDNHDIATVNTHALAYTAGFGKGSIAASTLRANNPAGQFVLGQLIRDLLDGSPPKASFRDETIKAMREKMSERRLDLTNLSWKFRPDPNNVGLQEGWHRRAGVGNWSYINVGKAWEAQGHENLDGWAWYQIEIPIPASWRNQNVYVSLEGADDYYEVFVNGTSVGTGGDREQRTTAFDQPASHSATDAIQFGTTNRIAIRVEDWQGSGGLFRPVWIGTAAISSHTLLK